LIGVIFARRSKTKRRARSLSKSFTLSKKGCYKMLF
jgi:hypothetical protein